MKHLTVFANRCSAATVAVFAGVALCCVRAAMAQSANPAPVVAAKDVLDMDLGELLKVRISPFDVSTSFDKGYNASNSVSASRFDSSIRELPFAIQAFTESFIEDQQPRDIFDVARYSPGVTYRSNDFNEGNANLAIRGFAVSGNSGDVQILRDGFHGPSIFDFTNISRVEVVKGPASFLYGQVAPGGIVNIITKSPQSQFAASADARYGSYGQYRFEADVTGPLLKTLFFRLPGLLRPGQPLLEALRRPFLGRRPVLALATARARERHPQVRALLQERDPAAHAEAWLQHAGRSRADRDRSQLVGRRRARLARQLEQHVLRRLSPQRNQRHLSGWIDLKAGDHWNLRTGYSHAGLQDRRAILRQPRHGEQHHVFAGPSLQTTDIHQPGRYRPRSKPSASTSSAGRVCACSSAGSMSLAVSTSGPRQAPNDPALGSNPTGSPLPLWDLSDPSTWNRAVTIPLSALTANQNDRTVRYEDRSFYGGTTFGFFDERLLLLAGARLTSTESRLVDNQTNLPSSDLSVSDITPQYGVLCKVTSGLLGLRLLCRVVRPRHRRSSTIWMGPPRPPSRPKVGQGIDVGLKSDLLGGRASGTITFFDVRNRNIVNDLSVTDSSGVVHIYSVQSGEQRSRGVEVDATITATDNWQIYSSYSYMDARIIEFSGNDAAILAQDPSTMDAAGQANYKNVRRFHNAPLQMSAPHLANLWTRYNFTQRRLRGLYVAGGFNFVYDQTLLPDTPTSAHQTYTLANAMVGYGRAWRGHRMDLHLMGKNLADEHYRPSQSTRGRPREILATLKAWF
jgi:iron complex outermembrane receptor protein